MMLKKFLQIRDIIVKKKENISKLKQKHNFEKIKINKSNKYIKLKEFENNLKKKSRKNLYNLYKMKLISKEIQNSMKDLEKNSNNF